VEEFKFNDKIIVVTGAVGLVGTSFCWEITKAGGTVILADVKEEKGTKLEQEINEKYNKKLAKFCRTDITDLKSIRDLINSTVNEFSKIDALVNNAYPRNKNYGRKFEDVTYEDFCENVNMHLGGYFLMMQQFAEHFKKQGHGNIINIASIYGVIAPRFDIYDNTDMTMPVEYAAIKSAIIHLTKYVAKYYKGYNIRVNCISPGGIYNNQPEPFIKSYNEYALNRGILDSSDITGILLFLLSNESKYINGQIIIVDDGWTL